MIQRFEVVQAVLNLFENPSYLEIGVDGGETFRSLKAARKIAVDPHFKFQPPVNEVGGSVAYHQVTSDSFFAAPEVRLLKFDAVYIDGLHTFEQVLRDLLNSIDYLQPQGVIVIDDILPNSYHASLPDLGEAFAVRDYLTAGHPELRHDATWMGDVFKAAFFIRSFMQQFSFATVAENHGQLVLWREPRAAEDMAMQSFRDVAAVDFRDSVLRRPIFNVRPLADILTTIQARRQP